MGNFILITTRCQRSGDGSDLARLPRLLLHPSTHLPNLTANATTYHKNQPTAMAAAGGGEPLGATLSRAIDASLQGDKQAQAFLEGLSTPDLSSVSGLTRSTFRMDHCCRRHRIPRHITGRARGGAAAYLGGRPAAPRGQQPGGSEPARLLCRLPPPPVSSFSC